MPQEKKTRLLIGGRVFVDESPTFEQEMYIMAEATAAGLAKLDRLELDPATKSLPIIAQQMIITAYKSGSLFKLMAALFTEDGQEWTEEVAEKNALFFRHVRDKASKQALYKGLGAAVIAFFESAASFGSISPTSSAKVTDSGLPASETVPLPSRLTPEQAGEVFRSGRMPSSSAKLPSTTTLTPKRSSAGKSAKVSSRTK